jgi:cytochrome c553
MDDQDDINSSIATPEADPSRGTSPESGRSSISGSSRSLLSAEPDEEVVMVDAPPPPQEVHPITNASMEHFDGEAFVIDGTTYLLKDIRVDDLRKFCGKNDVKTTLPPHKSCRSATKKVMVEEIKAKKGRMQNNEPDPWVNSKDKDDSKPTWVNRYRLANVVFSDECRPLVSNRGKCLTREELDIGMKTDQLVFEKVAAEYNKNYIALYDEIQFPEFTVTGAKNLPSNFVPIDWNDAKKITKECIHHLEKARKNFQISGCHDSDIEDAAETNGMDISRFTNYHYVVYWNLFAEVNKELFSTLTGELDATVFQESGSSNSVAGKSVATVSSKKQKRNNNDMLVDAFTTTASTDKKRFRMEEKRLEIDGERNKLLEKQVAAVKAQADAVCQACHAEKLHKLTADQSILRTQQQEYRSMLVKRYGNSKEVKARMKAHQQRKLERAGAEDDDTDESNASVMDHMEDISCRLRRIQEDILDHYRQNQHQSNQNQNGSTV